MIDIAGKLYRVFTEKEATLTEINPLVETANGKLIAADGRLNVDDNALFRHPDLNALRKESREHILKDRGIDYIDLGEGEIGLLCAGAGMTMLTMDLVALLGNRARCFLDISHGVNSGTGVDCFRGTLDLLSSDPNIKYVLFNMFGGLTRMEVVANAFLEAIRSRGGFPKPILIRMQGTNSEEGRRILSEAGYSVHSELSDLMESLRKALEEAHQ
jgi:succinyl-CoA synthetase beta subunit